MNSQSPIYASVVKSLRPYAPNYPAIERRGARILKHLQHIIESGDPLLAAKAAYIAARIWSSKTPEVLKAAFIRKETAIRLAAMLGARSVALRKGKFQARRASRQHIRCLCKMAASMRRSTDCGMRKIVREVAAALSESSLQSKRSKAPRAKAPVSAINADKAKSPSAKSRNETK